MVAYPFSHYLWDYVLLWHTLAAVSLTAQMDRFTWKWTTTGEYTAASAYRIMHEGHTHTPGVRRVWRSWAPQRVKFFTWLALKRRLWTADRRRRHGLDAHDKCWLCDQEPETTDHLLINCSFAKTIWWHSLSSLDCLCTFHQPMPLHQWWDHLRRLQDQHKKRGFYTLFLLVLWAIWKERNNRLFARQTSTVQELLERIKLDIELWIRAGATHLGCLRRE